MGVAERSIRGIDATNCLFVNPLVLSSLVLDGRVLSTKPKRNLLLCRLNSIRSMTNVTSNINSEITSNSTRLRSQWVSSSQQNSSLLDNVFSLPNHGYDWSGRHVVTKAWVKGLSGEVFVVLFDVLLGSMNHLESNEGVTPSLESGDDLSNEVSLDAV